MSFNSGEASEYSLAEADSLGAFVEDAITEEDALASLKDEFESPEEALPLVQK